MSRFDSWSLAWTGMLLQWRASARLRLGVWVVIGILLLYGMQLVLDSVDRQREQYKLLNTELLRLRALSNERYWPDRAKEADQLDAALASMAWGEADLGLTEAALQDWLRNAANRLGLKTRELTIARVDDAPSGARAQAAAALPPGHVLLRARISFELQRAPLMAFLAECARSERSVVVERLTLHGLSQPQVVELDLRVLARAAKAGL